jgi:deoxyribodipyrimidine photolyase-related protein
VHEWYLSVYADAFEWVEAPNTVGMSQFADGGVVGSKPYVSRAPISTGCRITAAAAPTGEGPHRPPRACPFNLLYWHFLLRHRDRFAGNPRMAQMYRTWDRMEMNPSGMVSLPLPWRRPVRNWPS